jgi:hypothetical protein
MIRRLFFSISLLSLCFMSIPSVASATTNLLGGVDCSQAGSSAVCKDNTQNNPLTGCPPSGTTGCGTGALGEITNIVAYVAGAAAVIIIIVSAIRLIASGSDSSTNSRTDNDVEDARRSIGGAVIGLAVIVLGKVLITYVISKL